MLMNRFKNFRVKINYFTLEMTIDRNTIVTLHKKGHSIPPGLHREKLHIRRETVCKVVKKFN